MRKILLLFLTALLFGSTVSLASCTANDDSSWSAGTNLHDRPGVDEHI